MRKVNPEMSKDTRPSRTAAPPRKKACLQCTPAKTRCSLTRPSCSRCIERGLSCEYSTPAPADLGLTSIVNDSSIPTPSTTALSSTDSPQDYSSSNITATTVPASTAYSHLQRRVELPISFTSVNLVTPLDSNRIRDRWLDFYFTPTTKIIKKFVPQTISLIRRTLASYPAMWIRSSTHLPPFIHHVQWSSAAPRSKSLSNCASLLRLCANAVSGSEALVMESVHREMDRLVTLIDAETDHLETLSALQSYLLLSIYAYNNRTLFPDIFNPNAISTLQDLASKVSAMGLICPEELGSGVPSWECWVIAEAKRRTVFCIYFLENLYNTDLGAASYVGEELALLPAPAAKWLWQAEGRSSWEGEFDEWAKSWERRKGLVMAELWPRRGMDGDDIAGEEEDNLRLEREKRIARWTEGADGFGMLLLAVCVATYDL